MNPRKLEIVRGYLQRAGWDPESVQFLAAGEYNENYRFSSKDRELVLRINHGSQLGLERQIAYEYDVLLAVAESGVTPWPFACDSEPAELWGGCLVMEYLHGRKLDYLTDLGAAARIFARVHALPVQERFIVQAHPVADIAEECRGLLARYPDHPRKAERLRLERYHNEIMELYLQTRELFTSEPLVMVNTEVNSGNFIIGDRHSWLVDWEKAVVSHRYQDLGHFLVPTTTLWKTDVVLETAQKRAFLDAYALELARLGAATPEAEALWEKTRVLEKTILLRALSWCYMAWYEYTKMERDLRNERTFAVMERYLDNMECFLSS